MQWEKKDGALYSYDASNDAGWWISLPEVPRMSLVTVELHTYTPPDGQSEHRVGQFYDVATAKRWIETKGQQLFDEVE